MFLPRSLAVRVAVLTFLVTGFCSGLSWNPAEIALEWPVPLLFGVAMTLFCRTRRSALAVAWLPISFAIWMIIYFSASWISVILEHFARGPFPAFSVLGMLGAALFAGAFSMLIRPLSWGEVGLLSAVGLIGGVAFAVTVEWDTKVGGTAPGFCLWQVAVGSRLVWLSVPEGDLSLPAKSVLNPGS